MEMSEPEPRVHAIHVEPSFRERLCAPSWPSMFAREILADAVCPRFPTRVCRQPGDSVIGLAARAVRETRSDDRSSSGLEPRRIGKHFEEEARMAASFDNAFSANMITHLLVSRTTLRLAPGDILYWSQYEGPRLDSGAHTLPARAQLVFLRLELSWPHPDTRRNPTEDHPS